MNTELSLRPFLLGIGSSLVAAILIFIFTRYVLPRIRGIVYRNPDISGTWKVEEMDGVCRGHLMVDQTGSRVSAEFRHIDGGRLFNYLGVMYGPKVALIFEEVGSQKNNVGTMVLNLAADGKHMACKTTFWHNDLAELRSNTYIAERQTHK